MQKPIAEIFTWPSESPQLIGTRCDDCGAVTFPAQSRCARCSSAKMTELLLPTRGTIIAWTTQGFPPKPGFQGDATGKNFQPFGVGLVQLGDVVRVESRLSESDPAKLDFGQEVELRIVPFFTDENGDEIMTFEFAPVGA